TSTPLIFNSTKAPVTVSAAPTVSITASNATIDAGQVETLSANVVGGAGPFTYAFWNTTSDAAVGSCAGTYAGLSVSCPGLHPTASTSYNVVVTDATSTPLIFNSTKAPVTVSAAPTVSITASNATIDAGQVETLSANVVGGAGPFTYAFWNTTSDAAVGSCAGTYAGLSVSCPGLHPTASTSYNVVVTDATSTPLIFNSTKAPVTVSAAPTVSITASNATIDAGQVETLSANVVGGAGPFTYAFWNTTSDAAVGSCAGTYAGLSVSCPGLHPTASTSYNVVVTDATSTPLIFNSTKAPVTVSAAPTVSITASNA